MANVEVLITGKVYKKQEIANVGQNYESQTIVLLTEDEYPQYYPIEMQKNTLTHVESIEVGQSVEINVNIRGRKWKKNPEDEDKYFTTLAGFRITKK